MIPHGPIYSSLRTALLEFYPESVSVKVGSDITCGKWLSTGSFVVKSLSASSIIIETDIVDFSTIWLTETENLINHCFEQLGVLINNDSRIMHDSDAWQLVTMYYYGFFAGQALLRLIGKPQVYLNKERLKIFSQIASPATKKPNAGTFSVKKIRDVSATKAEYEFKNTGKKNHEALWTSLFNYIEEELHRNPKSSRTEETLLYQTLVSNNVKKKYNSLEWPSLIRTDVNYIPGFAYQLLFNRNITKMKGLTKKWRQYNEMDLQKILRSINMTCAGYHEQVCFMSFVLHVVFILTRTLYEELFTRRNLDKRWELYRSKYCKSVMTSGNDYILLLRTFK